MKKMTMRLSTTKKIQKIQKKNVITENNDFNQELTSSL